MKQIVDVNGDVANSKKIKKEYDVVREKKDGTGKESVHKEDEFKHAKDNECAQHMILPRTEQQWTRCEIVGMKLQKKEMVYPIQHPYSVTF